MPLFPVVITLIVVGVLLYLMNAYIPMDPKINRIINALVIVVVVLWVLQVFGIFSYMSTVTVPRR